MDFNFDDNRAIRALVIPLGSNSLFNRQFQLISQRTEVDLRDITIKRIYNFTSHSKWKNGSVEYEYLKRDDPYLKREEKLKVCKDL